MSPQPTRVYSPKYLEVLYSRPRRFGDLPRRGVVERTFSWLGQNRRMNKDYERLAKTSEAFVYVEMTARW